MGKDNKAKWNSSSVETPRNQGTDKRTPHKTPELGWLERRLRYIYISTGLVGFFASFMLIIEEIHHIKNPTQPLGCDLNPIIGCGSIMDAWQGHVLFGVPNQIWGLAAFASLTTIGVTLVAGARFKRWLWLAMQAGMAVGLFIVLWFLGQSLFVLKHLCPYCMLTWAAILPAVWYTTLYCIQKDYWRLPRKLEPSVPFIQKHHFDILFSIYLAFVVAIIVRFWYYWQTVI